MSKRSEGLATKTRRHKEGLPWLEGNPLYAVPDHGNVEVDEQSEPFVGQPQVAQELGREDRRVPLDRFDLDDDDVVDDQVEP